MSYVKNTWAKGDIITAEKLNHMEDGIAGGGSGKLFAWFNTGVIVDMLSDNLAAFKNVIDSSFDEAKYMEINALIDLVFQVGIEHQGAYYVCNTNDAVISGVEHEGGADGYNVAIITGQIIAASGDEDYSIEPLGVGCFKLRIPLPAQGPVAVVFDYNLHLFSGSNITGRVTNNLNY